MYYNSQIYICESKTLRDYDKFCNYSWIQHRCRCFAVVEAGTVVLQYLKQILQKGAQVRS